MPTPESDISREELNRLVADARNGVPGAMDALLAATHARLLKMAEALLRNEQHPGLLEPSALVNEAFLQLRDGREWCDVGHYYGTWSVIFHRRIVDHARQNVRKRELFSAEDAHDSPTPTGSRSDEDLLALDSALRRLAEVDPRRADIIDRVLQGFSQEEIALALTISLRTVKREYRACKEWLRNEVTRARGSDSDHKPQT